MAINSKKKGNRGELEIAEILRAEGWSARRGQQYQGTPDSPDIDTDFPLHLEVKRVERLNLRAALDQAAADAGGTQPHAVAHRANGQEWVISMPLEQFLRLFSDALAEIADNDK